jgi:hypothetical protein
MSRVATTSTPLAGSGTYVSGTLLPDLSERINGSVFADQIGTLYVEESPDNVNWDVSKSFSVVAGTGQGFSEIVLLPYLRLRYVNGGTAQGSLRIFSRMSPDSR